jgi:hypothetical protein
VRIELAEFGPAPRDDWSCYPGLRPEYSYLFCGDHLRALDRIDFEVELAALDASPLDERTPVLAYGSNACPPQLARKLADTEWSPIVPMTRAWAQNLAVAYSDHESRYGAVPATVIASEGACTEVFIAWLDDEQLVGFDRSEGQNYERRSFDLARHEIYVADGRIPDHLSLYVSTRGVFSHDGVVPAVKGIDTTYRAGPLLTQTEVRALRCGT